MIIILPSYLLHYCCRSFCLHVNIHKPCTHIYNWFFSCYYHYEQSFVRSSKNKKNQIFILPSFFTFSNVLPFYANLFWPISFCFCVYSSIAGIALRKFCYCCFKCLFSLSTPVPILAETGWSEQYEIGSLRSIKF